MPNRPYEVIYIIDPDVNAEDTGAVVERFRALAESQGATDLRVDTQSLGRRRLAYEIDHKREGQYVVMNFESGAEAPAEVERVLNITDSILRSMVIRLDEMPAQPEEPPAPENPEATGDKAEPAGLMEGPAPSEASFPTPNEAETPSEATTLTDATQPDQPAVEDEITPPEGE